MSNGFLSDGSIRHFKRQYGEIEFRENAYEKLDLKLQPNIVKRIKLHFHGRIDYLRGAVGNPLTPGNRNSYYFNLMSRMFDILSDEPYTLVKRVQLKTSNGGLLKDVSGRDLAIDNFHKHHVKPYVHTYIETVGEAAETKQYVHFWFDLYLDFDLPETVLQERTALNSNSYNELTLGINWGSILDLWSYFAFFGTDVAALLLIHDLACSIIPFERTPISPEDELLSRQQLILTSIRQPIDGTRMRVDLPENTMIKSLSIIPRRRLAFVSAT